MDGTIYLLHLGKPATILAFDVDDERRCGCSRRRIAAGSERVISNEDRAVCFDRIISVWDCGGVLVLYFDDYSDGNKVWLYDVATKKLFRAEMPGDLTVASVDCYEISWGYKPTLVSPGSIVGEFDQDLERRRNRSAHITGVINLLGPLDRRKGQEATLNTVCLMEFLVRIMQKLPHDLQDVVEMPEIDSDDPGFLFESSVCSD
ncbi:hypothetical protein C2845_PM15G20260 [Panicum miliaceum]|uniref:Uncharacterized protein n=1 Tax=Panicum miliaceum TaxID=4540 RepID=A0A3L6QA84_PANMI|nr:hypothetical protein C2845_PM15G20260 [Panicum miliaceum]